MKTVPRPHENLKLVLDIFLLKESLEAQDSSFLAWNIWTPIKIHDFISVVVWKAAVSR